MTRLSSSNNQPFYSRPLLSQTGLLHPASHARNHDSWHQEASTLMKHREKGCNWTLRCTFVLGQGHGGAREHKAALPSFPQLGLVIAFHTSSTAGAFDMLVTAKYLPHRVCQLKKSRATSLRDRCQGMQSCTTACKVLSCIPFLPTV